MKNFTKMERVGPFSFEGNEIAILAIHGGGGGSAADLKSLGKELSKKAILLSKYHYFHVNLFILLFGIIFMQNFPCFLKYFIRLNSRRTFFST